MARDPTSFDQLQYEQPIRQPSCGAKDQDKERAPVVLEVQPSAEEANEVMLKVGDSVASDCGRDRSSTSTAASSIDGVAPGGLDMSLHRMPRSSTSTTASSTDGVAPGCLEAVNVGDYVVRRLEGLAHEQAEDDSSLASDDESSDSESDPGHETTAADKLGSSHGQEQVRAQAVQAHIEPRSQLEPEQAQAERALLVTAIARVLTQLASLGQSRYTGQSRCIVSSSFHAVRSPLLSIEVYLDRIARYFLCSDECLVLGLVYIDRLMKLRPDFVVNNFSIHRLIATSMTISSKFFDDNFYANSYYSRVAGIPVKELNTLEAQFLKLLEWGLHVLPEEFDLYKGYVLKALQGTSPTPAVNAPSHQHANRELAVPGASLLPHDTNEQAVENAAIASNDDSTASRVVVASPEVLAPKATSEEPPAVVRPVVLQVGEAAPGGSLATTQSSMDQRALCVMPAKTPSEPRPEACYRPQARFATAALAPRKVLVSQRGR